MMNVLILCTYPIKKAVHGGQLRVKNIADAYFSAGHQVQVVGVLGSDQYVQEDGFLPYPGAEKLARVFTNTFLMEDYAIAQYLARNEGFIAGLMSLVKNIPEYIHVEQPWLFDAGVRIKSKLAPNSRLIYGSQNVEWRLKREILKSYLPPEAREEYAELIRRLEVAAAQQADLVLAVSRNDADWLEQQTNKPVLVVPNGVRAWKATYEGQKEAAEITNEYRYALYCASAHPPNMKGFFDIFGGGFGSLKPDEKLVIAGGAGWAIAGDPRVHQSPKLAEKVLVAGIVSQSCLEGLLDGAQCIVLPLTQGGGTNLKTAEALWSGKHVVATTIAMRGFESFINAPGVTVTDDPSAFKRALRDAMARPVLRLTEKDIQLRQSVLWETCLSPLPGMLETLVERKAA